MVLGVMNGNSLRFCRYFVNAVAGVCGVAMCSGELWAQDLTDSATATEIQFFETHVRPLLIQHCYECHSGDVHKGGLVLDSRSGAFAGGDSGPAVVAGQPDESPLIHAVRYEDLEMPPKGKLPQEKIDRLVQWVQRGAAWPADSAPTHSKRARSPEVTDADRQYWAFQPIVRPNVPEAARDTHPIDALLNAGLAEQKLIANPSASTRTIIQRVFFGLTGLPPDHNELNLWTERLGDAESSGPNMVAYRALIDELLNRSSYGEHWARHWLDVVRFGQSNGYERDGFKPESWRYRDYVVQAFCDDKPYDRFVLEQLAGDELPDSDADSRIATGFYRLGVWDDEPDDARQAEFDELDDVLVTIGAAFMGLTIGCARCHEHKFDPIPQADYYRLLAFLRNVRRYENPRTSLQGAALLPIDSDTGIREAYNAFLERKRNREDAIAAATSEDERRKLEAQPLDDNLTGLAWTLGVREHAGVPPATHILVRGDAGSPGTEVEPGFPQVLTPGAPPSEPTSADAAAAPELSLADLRSEAPLNDILPSSGRRLALARWLTDHRHPLTARVIVNRVWHYHFGRGIVATTGDFGRAGSEPSHPALLDWLAADFVEHGWSLKRLHRTILTSQAYRRSSRIDLNRPEHQRAMQIDPGNSLLWRSSLHRLDAEAIRDRMLFTSGELNPIVGGPEMYPQLSGEVLAGQSKPGLGWQVSPPQQQARRSLYAIVKRGVRDPLLQAFDYSSVSSPLTERPITTVAPQALMLLHSRFTAERSQHLAQQLAVISSDRREQIHELYRRALQREPSKRELQTALTTLDEFESQYQRIAGRISFRPDVPVSLFGEYRRALSGEQYLLGPPESWKYFSGVWGGGYEGIEVVEPQRGPFALWQGGRWCDGTLRGRLRVDASVEYLTLIARGHPAESSWTGIGLTFDRIHNSLTGIERMSGAENVFASADITLPADTWTEFEWNLKSSTSRFRLDGASSGGTVMEQTSLNASEQSGFLGVAVWGGQLDFEDLQWIPGSGDSPSEQSAEESRAARNELAPIDPTPIDLVRSRMTLSDPSLPSGWSRYDGDWTRETDGTWHVTPNRGAKILWDAQPVPVGEVRVEMKFTQGQAHIAGLLLCVSDPAIGADNWYGYEVSLDADAQTVFVGDHRHSYRQLKSAPAVVQPETWHRLRAVLEQDRLRVFVDAAEEPSIELDLPNRLSGQLTGLRTWGSDLHYRGFTVRTGDLEATADWPSSTTEQLPPRNDEQFSRQQGLAALCRTLFNLSEFVYVE
ncbi:MAG: DUF1553 domain-containing protein [Planctomycetaceae bacterium]